MNSNSNHLRRYSTPRRLQPIDPDAFYAVDSCVLGLPQRVPEPFTRPERRGASGNKLGLRLQRNPPCATEWTTIMQEEEYNKRQPTHTYQQPLIPTAAPVPGSIFNRHGGSKSNRRGHPWGEKALARYLGNDCSRWREYDATALLEERGWRGPPLLVDQGTQDPFLDTQLKPHLLSEACARRSVRLNLRMQDGYDHSYFFIASFIDDHLRFHARDL